MHGLPSVKLPELREMATPLLESLLHDYDRIENTFPGAEHADLLQERRRCVNALTRQGMPTPHNEKWKYTNLRALEQRRYSVGDKTAATRDIDFSSFSLPELGGLRLVFVNGVFRADLSKMMDIPGVTFVALAAVMSGSSANAMVQIFAPSADAFTQLNAALVSDGPVLKIAANVEVISPIHFVFIGACAETDLAWQIRSQVELGEGATLTLVEHYIAAGSNAHLGNIVSRYVLGHQANLHVVQWQNADENSALVRHSTGILQNAAKLSIHNIELGAQLTRHDMDIHLNGMGAAVTSRGIFVLHGRQHADTQLAVHHNAQKTTSNVIWRGVADQRARGVFRGAITVAKGADGADAKLSNKNLLLSPSAEIDTQPVLEIYADEVQASHGATVGQLDEQALFYLRVRGLPVAVARQLLTYAFCCEGLADLPVPELQAQLETMLLERLPYSVQEN